MALFFDHLPRRTAAFRPSGEAPRARHSVRDAARVPHHICLRLVSGWLVALTALFAAVLAFRWLA